MASKIAPPEKRPHRFKILRGGDEAALPPQSAPPAPDPTTGTTQRLGAAPPHGLAYARARLRTLAVWAAEIGEPRIAIRLSAYALILGESPDQVGPICTDLAQMAQRVPDDKLGTELLLAKSLIEKTAKA